MTSILKTVENQPQTGEKEKENECESFPSPPETNVRLCWHCGAVLKPGDFAICDECRADAYRRNHYAYDLTVEDEDEIGTPMPDDDLGGDEFEDDDWDDE